MIRTARRGIAIGAAALLLAACNADNETQSPTTDPATVSPSPVETRVEESPEETDELLVVPDATGALPDLPETVGDYRADEEPSWDGTVYTSSTDERGIRVSHTGLVTTEGRFESFPDGQIIGHWYCGTFDSQYSNCVANAWDGVLGLMGDTGQPFDELVTFGDQLIEALK